MCAPNYPLSIVRSHTILTGWENREPGNRGHGNRVTETRKAIWECGAIWRIQLNGPTSFNPTYDIHTKFHRGLICFLRYD